MKFIILIFVLFIFSSVLKSQTDNNIITADNTPDIYQVTGDSDDYNRVLIINPVKGNRNEALKFHNIASAYYKKKDYKSAEIAWIKSVFADSSWGRSYYNLACLRALNNDKELAIGLVEKALQVSNGSLLKIIMSDHDLDSIKNEKSFLIIVKKYETK